MREPVLVTEYDGYEFDNLRISGTMEAPLLERKDRYGNWLPVKTVGNSARAKDVDNEQRSIHILKCYVNVFGLDDDGNDWVDMGITYKKVDASNYQICYNNGDTIFRNKLSGTSPSYDKGTNSVYLEGTKHSIRMLTKDYFDKEFTGDKSIAIEVEEKSNCETTSTTNAEKPPRKKYETRCGIMIQEAVPEETLLDQVYFPRTDFDSPYYKTTAQIDFVLPCYGMGIEFYENFHKNQQKEDDARILEVRRYLRETYDCGIPVNEFNEDILYPVVVIKQGYEYEGILEIKRKIKRRMVYLAHYCKELSEKMNA